LSRLRVYIWYVRHVNIYCIYLVRLARSTVSILRFPSNCQKSICIMNSEVYAENLDVTAISGKCSNSDEINSNFKDSTLHIAHDNYFLLKKVSRGILHEVTQLLFCSRQDSRPWCWRRATLRSVMSPMIDVYPCLEDIKIIKFPFSGTLFHNGMLTATYGVGKGTRGNLLPSSCLKRSCHVYPCYRPSAISRCIHDLSLTGGSFHRACRK
jgi:hypothetical protein